MTIKFTEDRAEQDIIDKIVDRALTFSDFANADFDKLDLVMDISAANASGCPLKLAELVEAKNFDFCHDIAGIVNNLDRNTGELKNCFLPRYAKPQGA